MPTTAQLNTALKACAAYQAVDALRTALVAAGLPPHLLDVVDACCQQRLAARTVANEPLLQHLGAADWSGLGQRVAEPTRLPVYGEGSTSYEFQRAFGGPINEQRLLQERTA